MRRMDLMWGKYCITTWRSTMLGQNDSSSSRGYRFEMRETPMGSCFARCPCEQFVDIWFSIMGHVWSSGEGGEQATQNQPRFAHPPLLVAPVMSLSKNFSKGWHTSDLLCWDEVPSWPGIAQLAHYWSQLLLMWLFTLSLLFMLWG